MSAEIIPFNRLDPSPPCTYSDEAFRRALAEMDSGFLSIAVKEEDLFAQAVRKAISAPASPATVTYVDFVAKRRINP